MAINFLNNGYFAGKVGIGVETPLTTLHLYDTGGSILRLASDAHTDNNKIEFDALNNGTIYHSIVSNTSSGNLQIRAGDNGSGHEVNIYTDGLFAATFDENQRLGVGTENPQAKLHVLNSAVGGNYYGQLVVESSGEAAMQLKGTSYSSIYFSDAAAPNQSGIVFDHSTNKLELRGAGNTDDLTITEAGDVGIGTDTPTNTDYGSVIPKLHVLQSSTSGAFNLVSRFQSGGDANDTGASILINHSNDRGLLIEGGRGGAGTLNDDDAVSHLGLVTSSGAHTRMITLRQRSTVGALYNVGIGTTVPNAKLEVSYTNTGIGAIVGNTTHNSQLQIYTAAAGKNSEIWFGDAGDADVGKIDYDHANDSMSFFINATKRLSFDSAGTMLLGDTTTAYQTIFFDPTPSTVYGNGTLQIQPTTSPGSGTAQFTTNFADRVGTGTTKHNVRVGGTVTATDFIGGSGAYLPLSAGSSYPLTGDLYLDDGSGASPSIYLKNGSDNYWRLINGSTGILALKEGTIDKLTFAAGGNATFAGNGEFNTSLKINAPDEGGAPAMTAIMNMHGYEGRGVGIKMKDNVNSAAGADDREWFVGTGYNQSGFNIGYASDGSQSSYAAQAKLSITTSGNATFAGNVDVDGGTLNVGSSNEVSIVSSGASLFPSLKVNNNGYLGSASVPAQMQLLSSGNTIFAGSITFNGTLNSTGNLILSTASAGANIEMYTNGNMYYDAVSHNFRDSDASPTYFNITASQVNSFVSLAMNNYKITTLATPTNAADAANKAYVDTTASGAANWASIGAGTRTNYTLGFQPPSTGYAGFFFNKSDGNGAGYFLVRGGADSDVYKQGGITLVGDGGTLTIATRTSASNVIRFMTGASSVERLNITGTGAFSFGNSVTNYGTSGQVMTSNGNATPGWTTINTGVLSVSDDGGSTINVSGSSTARVVAAVTGAVSLSSANLATGAQIQTAINSATTGALKFISEWSASGTAGGSPDLRATSTHVPGNYYIVSVAGSATPNGAGTTPNEWAVGDWCIRADLATDTWQKIDNTQVGNVTGSGSNTNLAIWNSDSNITSSNDFTTSGTRLIGTQLAVGDGTDGFFYSDSAGRTAFSTGDFYIQNTVNNYYNYATNIHLGATSGDNVLFRGNTITGTNWGITPAGAATFSTLTTGGTLTVSGNTTLSGTTNTISGNTLFGGYTRLGGRLVNQYIANLSASGQQARQYEIARAFMDYNDWNNTGVIKINLMEQYFDEGIGKEYAIRWGYNNTVDIDLINIYGGGDNANGFECVLGTLTQIGTSDIYYLPIIVKVRYYATVGALVTTNRSLTTSATSTSGGVIYINPSPTAVNISDFSIVDSVEFSGAADNINLGTASTKVGIGFADSTLPTQALDVNANMRLRGSLYDVNNSQGSSGDVLVSTGSGVDWVPASTPGTGTYLPLVGGTMSGTIVSTATTALQMDGAASAQGLLMQADSSGTYPVFLRSLNPASGGETSPWLYKETSTPWGIWHNNPSNSFDFTRSGNNLGIANNVGGQTNSVMIRLNSTDGSGTFAGAVTSPTFTGDLGATSTINTGVTGTTQTAGNNSTKIATTAYADAAAGAVDPSGVYLPLAGGNMTGGLGLNDQKLYLRTNGDNNHYLWNNASDYEELVAWSGSGFQITSSTGVNMATFTSSTANLAIGGDLTVSGGDITLVGTGRIQGIDTVSAGTDAANKDYVDGFLPLAGGTLTGGLTGTSVTMTGGIKANQGMFNNVDGLRLINPGGGSSVTQTSTVTGAIKITLPVSHTNTMMRMTIKVYEYTTNESFTVVCGGYNYSSGNTWYNVFAYIESSAALDRNFTVRFGYGTGKGQIYIGELNSQWSYPQVFVTDFQAGYSSYVASSWQTGWDVDFEASAFGSVTRSISNCQVNNWSRDGVNLSYTSGSGNVLVTTQPAGNNTTRAASTAFVTAAVAAVPIGNYLPIANPTFTGTLTGPTLAITGNSLLGNSSGDYTHVNDILHVGATDSGDADLYFGEGSTGAIAYGVHWDWDSGYTFTWNTRNNNTDTALMSYMTNDLTKVQWFRNFDMNNNKITELATPTATTDAANKAYVDTKLPIANPTFTGTLTGPTANFTGDVTIGGRDLIFSNTGTNDANITSSLGINFIVAPSGLSGLEIDSAGGVTTYNVLTTGGSIIVEGGGIQLNGTGRIEGIDTVTDSTDAANKAYVDNATSGAMTGFGVSNLPSGTGTTFTITNGQTVGIVGGTNIQSVVNTTNETITLNYTGGTGSGSVTSVTAGSGMTQTGTSTINPTLNVIGGTGITANANDVAIDYAGSDSIVMAAPGGNSPDADDYMIYGADSSGGGESAKVQFVDIPLSIFDNDAGFITNSGVVLTSGTQSISGTKSFTDTIVTNSSETRNKISVWSNSSEYTIGMMSGYTYGGLGNEYAMSFQMNNNSTRGFWWGDNNHTNAQGAMALTTSGLLTVANAIRLGYGETDTTSPGGTYALDVSGNTLMNGVGVVRSSDGVGDFYLGNYATNKHFRFHTNNNQTYFDMNCGQINWREGSSTRYYFYPSTANMTINGTLTQNSDSRVKENVVEIGNCISKVQAMRGVYYNRTDFNTEVTKVGVIAQEVEAVLPELILEASDTGLKSVAYAELTAVLINAIKEQQEIIEDLKTRITKLEN